MLDVKFSVLINKSWKQTEGQKETTSKTKRSHKLIRETDRSRALFCCRLCFSRSAFTSGLRSSSPSSISSFLGKTNRLVNDNTTLHFSYLGCNRQETYKVRKRKTDAQLVMSTRRITLGDRAFSVAVVCTWNGLPPEIRNSDSLLTFRRTTKTHFFTCRFYNLTLLIGTLYFCKVPQKYVYAMCH